MFKGYDRRPEVIDSGGDTAMNSIEDDVAPPRIASQVVEGKGDAVPCTVQYSTYSSQRNGSLQKCGPAYASACSASFMYVETRR
jgi:hypothetical protein